MKTGLTRPIPPAAMPVVKVLRSAVKRPRSLPKSRNEKGDCLHWRINDLSTCPMGLHPQATYEIPDKKKEFPIKGITRDNVLSFAKWWDAQVDPKAAVSAVWPA